MASPIERWSDSRRNESLMVDQVASTALSNREFFIRRWNLAANSDVGWSAGDPHTLVLRNSQLAGVPADTEAAALARALENRPDLKAARLRERFEEAGFSLAKSQAVPNATAFARYGRESVPTLAPGGGSRLFERENVMEFGVSIPIPFFNRQQGNIAEASSLS